jgi:hypothetical protein
MRLGAANPARARRVGALICATLWLGAFGAASARHVVQAASPPIVIPPATQIAPPSAPPPPPEPPPPAAAAPGTQPAPRSLLPTSIDILRDPLGSGIVMSGQLTGGSESALAVLLAIFAHSEAFDPTPKVKLAAADRDDRAAQALFTASVHGWPVTGVAAAALSESGGDVAVFYDYTPSFPASFARLRQALVQGGDVTLPPLHLADGSAVSLAPGWRVVDQGSGAVDLAGPLGEFAALGATIPVYAGETRLAGFVAQGPCCDPVATLRAVFPQLSANAQRNGQPVQILTGVVGQAAVPAAEGGQAALVLASLSLAGRAYSYLALTEATGGFTDPWMFRLSAIAAPQPVFAAELPGLFRIWGSYSANPPGLAERLYEAARKIETLQPMLQPASARHPAAGSSPGEAWDLVIPEVAGSQIDDGLAEQLTDRLAKDTGRGWRVIPAAELP